MDAAPTSLSIPSLIQQFDKLSAGDQETLVALLADRLLALSGRPTHLDVTTTFVTCRIAPHEFFVPDEPDEDEGDPEDGIASEGDDTMPTPNTDAMIEARRRLAAPKQALVREYFATRWPYWTRKTSRQVAAEITKASGTKVSHTFVDRLMKAERKRRRAV